MRPTARPTRSNRPALAAIALLAPALLLSACGDGGSGDGATSSAASSGSASASASASATPLTPAATGDLAGVTVGGTKDKPKLTLAGNKFSIDKTTVKVVTPGSGKTLAKGDKTLDKTVVVDGATGATVYDSFATGKHETWTVGDPQVLVGISKALLGQKVGSRILAAMPASDAFGDQGQQALKIGKGDPLVFLIDISTPPTPLKQATGAAVAPKAGFPTATFVYGKPSTITVPKTKAPTKLESEVLVQGTGPVVQKGQTLQALYTGVTWADGKVFDSSFNHGTAPAEFPIGVGQVIPGWDKALVGQKVGSRVLVVIPPADGYGTQAQKGIPANSTLVFLVDIVGAY